MKKLFIAITLSLAALIQTANAYELSDFKPENQKIIKRLFKDNTDAAKQLIKIANSEVGREIIRYNGHMDMEFIKNGKPINYRYAYSSLTEHERNKLKKVGTLDDIRICWYGADPNIYAQNCEAARGMILIYLKGL